MLRPLAPVLAAVAFGSLAAAPLQAVTLPPDFVAENALPGLTWSAAVPRR